MKILNTDITAIWRRLSALCLAVRRICNDDCCQVFRTGEKRFDYGKDGKPIELSYYLEKERTNGYLSYVFEKDGEIIGILLIRIVQNVLYLSRIGIKEAYRTKGNGFPYISF